jgi:histone arginine demethylase JMJD6
MSSQVPSYFQNDLYEMTDYTRAFFPCHRYFIIGPDRTGSNLHIDPSCTSAWNTLVSGLKRWALFPPGESQEQG